ncbi:MAG TPA: twin-arginine translocase subunit TatC [Polyangiaceae bacterium]|nr:twin-arginine translocase subunit TatC [Polyangiaceae bacterium]
MTAKTETGKEAAPAEEEGGAMSFWEHLEELRKRVVYMAFAFALGAGAAWHVRQRILLWISMPFIQAWQKTELGGKAELHFPAPQSLFIAYVKLALIGGLIFSLPILLYQVWAFVSPGLYSKEKRYAIPFVVSSCGLFALGSWFGWRFAFPVAFQYLLSFSGPVGTAIVVQPAVMIDEYIQFVSQMLVAFGSVFELPVLVFFLSVAGLVTYHHMLRFTRVFIVIAFVIAAIITPPDPLSQLILAIPLCLLYFLSIGVAWLFGKRDKPPEPAKG